MKTKDILVNLKERLGIETPNAMQLAMASANEQRIMLAAPTGSGKTIAFALRLLRNVDSSAKGIKAVVLAPSRELAIQIFEVLRPLATGLKTVVIYGGHAMSDEVNSLSVSPDIIVATPGRIVDHLNRGTLDIAAVKSVVLDEYDKSLDLGFQEQMRRVMKNIRRPSLIILTSATPADQLPLFMGNMADYKLYDYSERAIQPELSTTTFALKSPSKDKLGTLAELLRYLPNQKVIIFVNHRESAERIYDFLIKEGLPAGLYHGALDQQQRRLAVTLVANGSTPILVATDLAARGLDLPQVGAVVHYHLPLNEATWTHRNGRTARQGAQGEVYVILSEAEQLPDNVAADFTLTELPPTDNPIASTMATLYFNAGKKEKISKGDIAGFVMQKGGVGRDDVGLIVVDDHYAVAAVVRDKAYQLQEALKAHKLKGQRVRVSLLRRL